MMRTIAKPQPFTVVEKSIYSQDGFFLSGGFGVLHRVNKFPGEMLPEHEGILWIRGHHTEESPEGRALITAWALVYK